MRQELSQAFKDPPVDVGLRDSKAHQLLIAYFRGWYAIPAPVNFTRHAGTCLVIGDKNTPTAVHEIQVGDCFRLGSVGLVVVAMRLGNGSEQQINPKRLACLQEESLGNFGDDEDEAYRAIDERKSRVKAGSTRTLVDEGNNADDESCSEAPLCYMCYDPHDTTDDPLVAPCECKGDTRYLHVSCLQKWYQNLGCGPNAVVIRTTANGNPACKICGSAYKTVIRNASGKKSNIVEVITSTS